MTNTHRIRAAHNGLHWIIAFNSNGDITEGEICVSNDLYTLFECTCGAKFDIKNEAIAHLNEIDANESGEAVSRFPDPAGQ